MFRTSRPTLLVALLLASVVAVPAIAAAQGRPLAVPSATGALCGTKSAAPTYKHVIVILEENHSFGSIYKSSSAPYLNGVIAKCGLATNYHNVTHPSLPNYLALSFGGSLGSLGPYLGDCSPRSCSGPVNANNVFNQLPHSWMSFEESMPSACNSNSSGNYLARHNPALYYSDLRASCAKRDVALGSTSKSALLKAFASERTAPALSFVTPNSCNDMHNCSVSTGDSWMRTWLPLIGKSSVYKHNDTVVFIVWDEGEPGYNGENCTSNSSDESCHVPLIVVAPSVKPGTTVSTSFSHYSLLKSIEDLLKLQELGGAKSATSVVKGFNL